jgi:Fe-S cluster biosynthesis and repair protein YggX
MQISANKWAKWPVHETVLFSEVKNMDLEEVLRCTSKRERWLVFVPRNRYHGLVADD